MIDLLRLRVFREVAVRRSFSGAALELNYTQSSVSQHVASLERELGATLLERTARPVAVTAAGEIVLRHAEELLGRASAIELELRSLTGGDVGELRLGGFFTAWTTFMPEAAAAYARAYPRVQLQLRQLEPEPALRALRAGELDLAVTFAFGAESADGPEILRTHLFDDPYALALAAEHPLARKRNLSLADLAGERWVIPPADAPYARVIRALCRDVGGFEPDVAFETVDIAIAQPLVASGLAVALLPALALRPVREGVVVVRLPGVEPARRVDLLRLAGRRVPTAEPMVEALVAAARAA